MTAVTCGSATGQSSASAARSIRGRSTTRPKTSSSRKAASVATAWLPIIAHAPHPVAARASPTVSASGWPTSTRQARSAKRWSRRTTPDAAPAKAESGSSGASARASASTSGAPVQCASSGAPSASTAAVPQPTSTATVSALATWRGCRPGRCTSESGNSVAPSMSSRAKAAIAIMPVPAASGPITRPMASTDSSEKTEVVAVSASTQAGEREAGRRKRVPCGVRG
jgi:hypothetical protein